VIFNWDDKWIIMDVFFSAILTDLTVGLRVSQVVLVFD